MPANVQAVLERFQTFVSSFLGGSVIDDASGFTVADAQLLIGEVEGVTSRFVRQTTIWQT